MSLNAHEQFILELINRGRLDPSAEAARFGIDLNEGLSPGKIGTGTMQVLAPNAALERASEGHSAWMLAADTFSHTGSGGSSAFSRIVDAGYDFTGAFQSYGENLAWGGSTAGVNLNVEAEERYNDLFLSASHRSNTFKDDFREIGIAHLGGVYKQYSASMLTETFGTSGDAFFVTGVAYTDSNNNNFYNIGEGRGDITIIANGQSDQTAPAGGYAIGIDPDAEVAITIRQGGTTLGTQILDLSTQNAKLDVQREGGTWELLTSTSLDLETGIGRARLLGKDHLDLIGHGGNNVLRGNAGNNIIDGKRGDDQLFGGYGWDTLIDGTGSDTLTGGNGRDTFVLVGDGLTDTITDWGNGDDTLDITAWTGVAAKSDLVFISTSGGVIITSEAETLVVKSAGGNSLSASSFSTADFRFGNLPSVDVAPDPIPLPEIPDLVEEPTSGATMRTGSASDNSIAGSSGNDHIFGYAGRDLLGGSDGADSLYGGNGNDRYILNSADDAIGGEIGYSLGGGIDTVLSYVDYVLPRNVEILRLQGDADINGSGGWAPEILVGNDGNNTLDGHGGNDRIVAKDGDDVLIGRTGADRLVGGAGADTFVLTSQSDSRAGADSRDFIHGFEHGRDKIDLTHVDADTLRGGHQSFDFIGSVAFSGTGVGSAGELRYFTFGGGNYNIVEADLDGDGTADMQIFVNLTHWMTGTDFIL